MKTAENLCFGFGCWGKDFFAKVSAFLSDLDMVDNQFFAFVIEDVDVHIE